MIQYINYITGGLAGFGLASLFFLLYMRPKWIKYGRDERDIEDSLYGIELIKKNKVINEEVKNMSDDELNKFISDRLQRK